MDIDIDMGMSGEGAVEIGGGDGAGVGEAEGRGVGEAEGELVGLFDASGGASGHSSCFGGPRLF